MVAIVATVLVVSPPAAGQSGVAPAAIPFSGFFHNGASQKCLDASNYGLGQNVIQWDCHYLDNQYWFVVPLDEGYIGLQNRASWQCLEGLGEQHGWNAIQADCGWGYSQHWYPLQQGDEWALMNVVTRKCLDASDGGKGLNVYTYTCHYGPNQLWSN